MTVNWLYTNPSATGLGDRLGTIIALSALANLYNSSYVVHMEWCTDPKRVLIGNPSHIMWIPKWKGYDYPIETLHATLSLPVNVRLFTSGHTPSRTDLRIVGESGIIPVWGGIMHTNTMFCRAIALGDDQQSKHWTTRECETAYRKAGDQIRAAEPQLTESDPFVLIHFRSPDDNTCRIGRDERPFCTRSVIEQLQKAGVYMKVISNNHSFSMHWLRGLPSLQLVYPKSAFHDMLLALNAAAIVQHSSTGWSSYTSVPAMARNIPLINTYTGPEHRYDFFKNHGEVPREFHRCHEIAAFMRKAMDKYTQKSG